MVSDNVMDNALKASAGKDMKVVYAMANPPKYLLMSAANPDGLKLEVLLDIVFDDMSEKCIRINADTRPVARRVLRNNQQIMALLKQARALQMDSLDVLAHLAPDQGPRGKPRIGAGSSGMGSDPDPTPGPGPVDTTRRVPRPAL